MGKETNNLTPSKRFIRKINDLYIQTRKKYLVQFPDNYVTMDRDKSSKVWTLNDGMIKRHLQGSITYGVFSGGYFNKFMTFDVDYNDHAMARWVTLKVIDTLVRDIGISRKDIHVSLSGSKGYHIDLFFDNPLLVADTEAFYRKVMAEVGELPADGDVEFRPSWTQGVKLPLGVHQRTGNRCWFVDNETLEPFESFDYIMSIEPMDSSEIMEIDFGISAEQAEEFERVVEETDITANVLDKSEALQNARKIIEEGRLIASGTRHKTTFTIACFGNMHGWEREETIAIIMDILLATPRMYFSKGSTPDHWHKEAQRLVDYAYDKDITLGNSDKAVTIYKSEIIAVLQVGTFRQKQLAYAMLVTSKRYGSVFYLTRSSAKKMIGTNSDNTIQRGIKTLVDVGFLEYVRRNEVDRARTFELNQVRHKPNKYRLLLDKPSEDEPSIDVTNKDGMLKVTYALCTVEEIRKYVKRYEFDNRWS